jgi:hypothetical protein
VTARGWGEGVRRTRHSGVAAAAAIRGVDDADDSESLEPRGGPWPEVCEVASEAPGDDPNGGVADWWPLAASAAPEGFRRDTVGGVAVGGDAVGGGLRNDSTTPANFSRSHALLYSPRSFAASAIAAALSTVREPLPLTIDVIRFTWSASSSPSEVNDAPFEPPFFFLSDERRLALLRSLVWILLMMLMSSEMVDTRDGSFALKCDEKRHISVASSEMYPKTSCSTSAG